MEEFTIYQRYTNELTAQEMEALALLSDLYTEEGKWPSERAFRLKLKTILGKENYQNVIDRLSPHFLFCFNKGSHNADYQLRLAGICALNEETFKLVCRYFDYLKAEYRLDPDTTIITSEELQAGLNLSDGELIELRMCVDVGGLYGSASFPQDKKQKWHVGLYRDIEELDNAESSAVYLKQFLLKEFKQNSERASTISLPAGPSLASLLERPRRLDELLHPKVIEASQGLFSNQHYSEASFRAVVALEKEVQRRSSTVFSGVDLMSKVFGTNEPIIKFNKRKTQTDHDEQSGLMHMFRGAIQAIRNPHAHENLDMHESEAKRILVLVSFLFYKLEQAQSSPVDRVQL